MANTINIFNFDGETLDQFLAKVVPGGGGGTYDDVFTTLKRDEAGEEADADEIEVAAGQIWGNGMDDLLRATYMRYFYTKHGIWRVADAAARDALGSDDSLGVDDVCSVDGDTLYRCTAVTGPSTSTWVSLAGAAPVSSVFGRVGAVVAAASDYDASQVDNDSGVAGATVADALDTLAATGASLPVGLPHADSIVFYVDASDPDSYPGSGTTVTDRAGNGSSGTLDGSATVEGGAFQIDGSGTKGVSFTKNATLDNVFNGGATLMTFVQLDSPGTSGFGRLVTTENGAQTLGWLLYGQASGSNKIEPRFFRTASGGNGSWASGRNIARGSTAGSGGGRAYASIAVAYDESVLSNDPTFTINGQEPVTPAGTNPSGTLGDDTGLDLIIGNLNGGGEPMDGQSAITIIWDRILTQEEIQQVHNLFITRLSRVGSVPGVVAVTRATANGSANLLANRGAEQPSILAGLSSCTNLQSETSAGHGFTGANTEYASILGGRNNEITDNCDYSVIAGGDANTIDSDGANFIGSGVSNTIRNHDNAVIAGGGSNTCDVGSGSAGWSAILGGFQNVIWHGSYSCIGGGRSNSISISGAGIGNAEYSVVAGGQDNHLDRGNHAGILSGQNHTIGATTDSSHACVTYGFDCEIDGADFGHAAGRQSKVTHAGASVWSDQTAQDEVSNRTDQHKRVFVGGFTERTTTGFGGSGTDPGEAVERFNGHATTTDATPDVQTIGTLGTNQQTMVFKVIVHSVQDAGANARFEEFLVQAYRTGGTVTVAGTSIASSGIGNGASVSYSFGATGDNIEITITGVAAQNWQHTFNFSRQKGGLTA